MGHDYFKEHRSLFGTREGDWCMKHTHHHMRHPRGHLGDRASAQGTRGCSWRDDQFGRGQNTVLGWSDPTFAHGSVPKVSRGSLQSTKRFVPVFCPGTSPDSGETRRRKKVNQVKTVGITVCTLRTATSSPDALQTQFILRRLQRPLLRKSPRKKGHVGRERPHFFCRRSAQKLSGGRSRPRGHFALTYCVIARGGPENLSDRMSDILYEHERRSPLSILKSPSKQPKAVTVQARVEESVKTQLELYAEFIDASTSYVITEALKLLFRKDEEFKRWSSNHANNHNHEKAKGDALTKTA